MLATLPDGCTVTRGLPPVPRHWRVARGGRGGRGPCCSLRLSAVPVMVRPLIKDLIKISYTINDMADH